MIAEDGDEYGYSTASLYGWQFGQALRWSDTAKALAVANEALGWVRNFNATHSFPQDDPRGLMFWHAIGYGQVSIAADLLAGELAEMDYESTDFSRIDDNDQSSMRGKWLGFVDRATTLLEHPEARGLVQAPSIDRAARYIGSATQHAMGALPVKFRWQTLMRTTPLG